MPKIQKFLSSKTFSKSPPLPLWDFSLSSKIFIFLILLDSFGLFEFLESFTRIPREYHENNLLCKNRGGVVVSIKRILYSSKTMDPVGETIEKIPVPDLEFFLTVGTTG